MTKEEDGSKSVGPGERKAPSGTQMQEMASVSNLRARRPG